MVRIEYRRGKSLLVFGFFGACALLLAWIFVSPDDFSHIRRARLFTGEFGRWVLLPIFLIASGIISLRAGMFAMGDNVALEMTSTDLRVNGFWGRKLLPWSEVRGAEVERSAGAMQLAVLTHAGGDFGNGKIRVPLGLAGLSDVQMFELARTIHVRCNTTIDPDAAITRHMEQRATVPNAASPPSVRTFGRKQA